MSDCRPLDADQAASYNPPSFARISGGQFTSVTTSPALFRLAARFDDVGFSDIVNIRNRVMELRAGGATVYQFEGGEPYMDTPDFIKEAISSALRENKTRYAPSSGIPELRRAIADKLQDRNRIPAREENVLVVNGGMQ